MTRLEAVLGSAAFVLFGGPTLVAGFVPWLLTRWEAHDPSAQMRFLGGALLAAGLVLVLETTARFAVQGRGTPAPFAAPERFVARGSYRFVRNPMYVGVLALIAGQAVLLSREVLWAWLAAAALLFHIFVVLHEEPALRRRFGAEYDAYRARVGRWIPGLVSFGAMRRNLLV